MAATQLFEMSPEEKTRLELDVNAFNKQIEIDGRKPKQELGKNDFLQLLIAQLSHQDPTAPMEDTQFVAQMAQFTSLEQMTNVSQSFEKLNNLLSGSEAVNAVGKQVNIEDGSIKVSGVITAATRGEIPQVQVDGKWYDWSTVKTVYIGEAQANR
ncbi:flagellar hook assembly protein FlgD [Treponema phagedenis]|nr:flagellar hook assembly protein FlgD [Treponema phagedenis]QEJ96537.1 flagellar hook assembly protein FlgD [Treponema phagedenis]QEJ99704.1 flagellar hook assembly protein FlgD [Treponema phagedenis]QEK02183.1 flagellar hook assembly protein FlgD [Treponema phagedenis]QEK05256.1 flagellar hook assembly protein FlgD [Treponema phagedenis]